VLAEYKKVLDIRSEIDAYIKHNSIFDIYLGEICNNTVGNTMMRILIMRMKLLKADGKNPTIEILYGDDDKCNEKPPHSKQLQIFIHKDNYDEKGISKDIVCGVSKDMKIVPKYLSYSDILFHELNHALHHMKNVYHNRFEHYDSLKRLYLSSKD
jgi:hypothetical protein